MADYNVQMNNYPDLTSSQQANLVLQTAAAPAAAQQIQPGAIQPATNIVVSQTETQDLPVVENAAIVAEKSNSDLLTLLAIGLGIWGVTKLVKRK